MSITADERAEQITAVRDGLLEYGYHEIGHSPTRGRYARALFVGDRIRHGGERYIEALQRGTGYVRHILLKPNSPWAKEWGRPDVELVIEMDQPRFSDSIVMQVADYHVALVEIVHATPPGGSGLMPCCRRTPFEVSRRDRLSSRLWDVNCDWPHGRNRAEAVADGA